jgi:hypothetical protein
MPRIQVFGMTQLEAVRREMDVGKLCKDCLVAHRLWRNTPEISSTEVFNQLQQSRKSRSCSRDCKAVLPQQA